MNWEILGIAFVALVHLLAIISGRRTHTRVHRVAFISGLLGLFSFPAVAYFGIKSLCVAGACRHIDSTALHVSVAIFIALALASAISTSVIIARRSRA